MTLLVSGIMVPIHFYLGWRLTKAVHFLTDQTILKWTPVILLATFYLLPLISFVLYGINGQVDLLKMPKPIMYWFWFGFAYTFQLLSWLIILDIIALLGGLSFPGMLATIQKSFSWLVVVLAISMFIYSGVKMYHDTTSIAVKKMTATISDLPASLDGFRIAHITDIQGDEYTGSKQVARYIDRVNALEPDMVVFTGDLISYGTDFITMSAREFGNVEAPYGTYAVVGDHDYWAGLDSIEPALKANGIPLLRDVNSFVSVEKDSILLTGVTQVYSKHIGRDKARELTSDSAKVPVKILLSHQPADFLVELAQENNYDLLLAGHTHGGQIRVPFFWKTYCASDMETSYISGQYRAGDLLININNGLGFTLAPVRYNAQPSVTLIELRRK